MAEQPGISMWLTLGFVQLLLTQTLPPREPVSPSGGLGHKSSRCGVDSVLDWLVLPWLAHSPVTSFLMTLSPVAWAPNLGGGVGFLWASTLVPPFTIVLSYGFLLPIVSLGSLPLVVCLLLFSWLKIH